MEPSRTSRIEHFYDLLVKRALYDVHGEKPILLLASFEHIHRVGNTGQTLSSILKSDLTSNAAKKRFVKFAEGKLAEPETSWYILVKNPGEMLQVLKDNSSVDESFSALKKRRS
jgi:hypothetical protein